MLSEYDRDTILSSGINDWDSIKVVLPEGYRKDHANAIRVRNGLSKFSVGRSGKPRLPTNDDYFKKTTIESCAYAGMIAADGCVSDGRAGQKLTSVTLKSDDAEYLHQMQLKIGGGFVVQNGYAVWRVSSDKIATDLNRVYNITPRKSLTLEPPVGLTFEQELAFIAGYIDGDGCYSVRENRPNLSILGTREFLSWTNSILFDNLLTVRPKDNFYVIATQGDKAIRAREKFINLDIPRLERKRKLWEKLEADISIRKEEEE